jgi:hypothetical protein
MPSSAVTHLASLLRVKQLDRTLLDARPLDAEAVVPSGIRAVDAALGGGWRRGELSEVWGARSSGRTSVLVSTLATATRQEDRESDLVALVDAFDRFDPVSAAAAGLALDRVLWVRGPSLTQPVRSALYEEAIKQAVRAFDLIVRAGGFAVVALDLAEVPARRLRDRLPWSTWLRIARVNEGQRTVCLLVGDGPISRSPRGASVQLAARCRWTGASAQRRRFEGFEIQPETFVGGGLQPAAYSDGDPAGLKPGGYGPMRLR